VRVVSLLAVILIMSAAPSGAALPEEVAAICRHLDVDAIFIGRPGKPSEVLVSFEDRIQPARERWLKAQAEADKSTDRDVHIKAIDAQAEYDHLRAYYPAPQTLVVIPIEVDTSFKGVTAPVVYMQAAMEKELDPGRPYIFFSYLIMAMFDDRILEPAGMPQPVETAELTLRLIQEALSASHGGTVIGSIDYELTGDPDTPAAAGGLAVRIASTGFMLNTSTDADGVFLVTGVPSGQISATPSLPNGLALVSEKSATSVLTEGGCVALHLRATLNGRIRGRVVGAGGTPSAALSVQLVSSAAGWQGRHYSTTTNDRGEFEFRAIPPGSYFVGHELIRSDLVPVGGFPPMTYYPGTPDRAGAIPIVVGNATQHDGFDFTVP
jgi:hypothetical protein